MNCEIESTIGLPRSAQERARPKDWNAALASRLCLAGLAVLFASVVADTVSFWLHDDNHTHGLFVCAASLGLVWVNRRSLLALAKSPTAWGLVPLALGLALRVSTALLRLETQSFRIWSIVLVLMGAMLTFHGRDLWRACRFPVLFMLTAGGVPERLVQHLSGDLQRMSSTGAAAAMSALGMPILRNGNLIEIPGCRLEVADVCSGIKKLMAMFAFAVFYGYICRLSPARRLLLIAAAIPVAVIANTIRIAGLIGVCYAGGERAMAAAHDAAEIVVLAIAYFVFVGFGRALGCKDIDPSRS
jgi:exosortase